MNTWYTWTSGAWYVVSIGIIECHTTKVAHTQDVVRWVGNCNGHREQEHTCTLYTSPVFTGFATLLYVLPLATPTSHIISHTPSIWFISTTIRKPHIQLPHLFSLCLRNTFRVGRSPVNLKVQLAAKDRRVLFLLARTFFTQVVLQSEVVAQ
jgi:hypothetical protein